MIIMETFITEVSPVTAALATLLVVAMVKLIDQLFDRDFRGASKILAAALVGVAMGFAVDGLTVVTGIALGLSASGLITTMGYTKKTTPVASAVELG